MRASALAAILLSVPWCATGPLAAQEPPPPSVVMVHLADGTSQPLRAWSLVYDYVSHNKSTPLALARPSVKNASELWAGKKTYPLAGATLALAYREVPKEIEVAGRPQRMLIQVARQLTLEAADGRKTEIEVAPPHRDLVIPGADKSTTFVPRSLDLVGETLTGTKRSFCVLSYSSLVECGTSPAEQVVKLSFQQ